MLRDAIRFSYINAKIRSLKSQLLTESDYENLIKFGSYKGMVEYLEFTAFKKSLHDNICSYDDLIEIYHKNLFEAYEGLINSLSGTIKRLVYHLYQKYELENLKLVLRTMCYNRHIDNVNKLFLLHMKYKSFSQKDLLSSKNVHDLIQKLKGTWYYEPLQNSYYRFEKEGEIFSLEMALDLKYHNQLWDIILSMSGKDRKLTQGILGVQLDSFNILWFTRFKESYHFSPEEIMNYSLVHGRYITNKVRQKLAYSINFKDIIANLEHTPYKRILENIDNPEIAYIQLLKYALLVTKRNWHTSPFQVGIILDYIFFKEMEIKDLITLTEAKRTGISPHTIPHYLVN
ncbi:MAG: V-type ATPase subunit [bacterium]